LLNSSDSRSLDVAIVRICFDQALKLRTHRFEMIGIKKIWNNHGPIRTQAIGMFEEVLEPGTRGNLAPV
jgi:hypothetical protein